jgi:hypothetical protein
MRGRVGAKSYPHMWAIDVADKPRSLNQERAQGRYKRSADTKLWRDTYGEDVVAQLLDQGAEPHDGEFSVETWVDYANQAHHLDLGNWYGAVKALVDRLVNDGMLVEDNPDYMYQVLFSKGGIDEGRTSPPGAILRVNIGLKP